MQNALCLFRLDRFSVRRRGLGMMLALALLAFPSIERDAAAAAANSCETTLYDGRSYSICSFDPRHADIRTFLKDEDGAILGGFGALKSMLNARGETLVFAMNGGMYDEQRAPLGLFVERGQRLHAPNLRRGGGNFYLKPNGVFWVTAGRAGVTETRQFMRERRAVNFATQSGPLLIDAGRINPHIQESGASAKLRNGVGVDESSHVRFVISNEPVTFHEFAHFFRDSLHCRNALYLDGSISALYAPSINRQDYFRPMGPMLGVVERR